LNDKGEVLHTTGHDTADIVLNDRAVSSPNFYFLKEKPKIYDRTKHVDTTYFVKDDLNLALDLRHFSLARIRNLEPWVNIEKSDDGIPIQQSYMKDGAAANLGQAKDIADSFKVTFALNRERYFNTFIDESGPLDTFVGVGSGLKAFAFIKNIGWHSKSMFYLFDTDPAIFAIKRFMLHDWTGKPDHFFEYCRQFKLDSDDLENMWKDQVRFITPEDIWSMKTRIVLNQGSITDFNKYYSLYGKTVIWWDGTFKYTPNHYRKTQQQVWKEFKDFIGKLPDDAHCYGTDPFYEFYNNISGKELKDHVESIQESDPRNTDGATIY